MALHEGNSLMDVYKVRVGIAAARELELEVEDTAVVIEAYERAVKKNEPILWINDVRGHRIGVVVSSVAFVEFDRPQDRGVGFGRG
jgi:Protein of unknown function (DUF3107)